MYDTKVVPETTHVPINVLLIETRKILDKFGSHGSDIIKKLTHLNQHITDAERNCLIAELMPDYTEYGHSLTYMW